jgi:crotonobetainyl-CoA:carnitine CoA-transferase CaiB-like acyl-CoA transferase
MGQHMMEGFMTGKPVVPMPERVRAWAVYDTFTSSDGERVFVGIVTDSQWKVFCEAFDRPDLLRDPELASNPQRVVARPRILPIVSAIFGRMTKAQLMAKCDELGLPYAPIAKPEDLFEDPHLQQSGGLAQLTLPNGVTTRVPALPIAMDGRRFRTRLDLPRVGEHSAGVLQELGYSASEIDRLAADRVIARP